jgi:hypothetical protein
MNVKGRTVWEVGISGRGGEGEDTEGRRGQKYAAHVHMKTDTTKRCLQSGGEGWKYNGGGELVPIHYMHVWDYHNEAPHIINGC